MATVSTSGYAGLARLYWMFFGPMLAALFAIQVFQQRDGWLTATNFAFLLLVVLLPAARWGEFRGGSPQTADGEPATLSHLRRYAVVAPLVWIVVWIVVNAVGSVLIE